MSEIRVLPTDLQKPFSGSLSVPGDKSISHRSAIFAGIADGKTEVTGFLTSEDCLATVAAMRAMGVGIEQDPADPTHLTITGCAGKLQAPTVGGSMIDCGNSGTTMRLLSGLFAAQPFTVTLMGDASLSRRPMGRVIKPLSQMGATFVAHGEKADCAPLAITGASDGAKAFHYDMPVASAQVKSAVLIAGLFAQGRTSVTEPAPTRNHTETMLRHFGVETSHKGSEISLSGPATLKAGDFYVPGDISSAAFWCVAAAARPGSELTLAGVGLNPTRTGILDVLAQMGADITRTVTGGQEGEPFGDVTIRGTRLKGTTIGGDIIPNVIDELPVIAVAACLASGETVISDATELRVKESDRIATVAQNLQAMGADVTERPDGMIIQGGKPLHATTVDATGDHRIAMAFSIAGLFASGETIIENAECVNTSYPGFAGILSRFV